MQVILQEKSNAKVKDEAHTIAGNCEKRGRSRDFDGHVHAGM
jgi:hypothetical protein